ncbi:MAG TPA: mycothiol conjugate amidase Mca, partial [Corynebacterium stationis]|nr:mycothiol conjugate amidase Mca [Corynebacterium stationis]
TSVATQARLWPTEEFELAQTRVSTSLPENDMLAGVPGIDKSLGEANN